MRIGDYELGNIRNKILEELYDKREKELAIRKIAIAKENRELYMEPLAYLLDQLPLEMISHADEYILKVNYAPNANKTEILLDDTWIYKTKDPIINPKKYARGGSYYSSALESKLDPRLQEKKDELCKHIVALRTEKEEMHTYLIKTTKKYSGSIKLRELWKDHPIFYKHLPPEPVKITKSKSEKKVSSPDLEVPTFLKDRMTINLLEDN